MGGNIWKTLVVFVASVVMFNAFAAAEQKSVRCVDANQAASRTSGMESFRNWFHNPADWLEMGADLQLHWTYGWNIETLNDHAANRGSGWNWIQNRMRWWTKTKISDDIDFNLRLTWEFLSWDDPAHKRKEIDFDEIIFDQFNLTVRNLFDMPLTMVAGRQDIILGNGWLVAEGTPLDCGRTIYFDALRFTYKIPDRDTTVDLVYIENRAAADAYLKPINDRHKQVTEQDERGVILYVTDKSRPNLQLEGYFIYKNDNPINFRPTGAHPSPFDGPWPAAWSKKAEIYTIGGAISGPIASSEHWKYRVEGAVQTGKKQTVGGDSPEHTLQAFGTVDRLEYHFNDAKKNELHGTFEYLSGDNPGTGKNEAFDPLWGEWPQWSKLIMYAYSFDTMVGEPTNFYRLGFGHSIQLTEKMQMSTDYHLLWAGENTNKNNPIPGIIGFSDSGKFRGQLATWQLKYTLTKNLKGSLALEYFIPGNYYDSQSRDNAYFAELNLEYTF
jgi:hypothetical protein